MDQNNDEQEALEQALKQRYEKIQKIVLRMALGVDDGEIEDRSTFYALGLMADDAVSEKRTKRGSLDEADCFRKLSVARKLEAMLQKENVRESLLLQHELIVEHEGNLGFLEENDAVLVVAAIKSLMDDPDFNFGFRTTWNR